MKINELPAIEYADDQIRKFKVQRVEALYRAGKIELTQYATALRRITQEWTEQTTKRSLDSRQPFKNSDTSA